MDINQPEWKLEGEWLQEVVKEAQRQFKENHDFNENLKKDAIETQRELWDNIGSVSVSNGLEQIVDFMSFINTMKAQKRSHGLVSKLEEKYKRIIASPYFGRIDFLEKGEPAAGKYYIGISNLINDDYDVLVYDWRAPVSSMFYDYEIGKASYKCPEGTISGELVLKRQYKISDSKLEYMFDSNITINDEILQGMLSKSSDSSMKAIVTTIQREQNRVIRNEEYKNLIVQGPAGSGKTSVALHRIAYLLYKHRKQITSQNILIFSPNEIFNEYISNVLPQLGEDNMGQTTFKDYMHKALGERFDKEDYCDMMEQILASKNSAAYKERINCIKYKSSTEFLTILKNYAAYVENMNRNFANINLNGHLIISAKDIKDLFFKDYVELPIKRRLQKIRERILFLVEPFRKARIEEVKAELRETGFYIDKAEITERSLATVNNEMQKIYNEINRMTGFDLINIYRRLFDKLKNFSKDLNMRTSDEMLYEVKRYTLENLNARKLTYEDQLALLYLKTAFGDIPKTSDIKYVIIDEAQDYTPLQYEILYKLFGHANMTILGDLNQSINPFMNVGSYDNISHIFPQDNTCLINLTKSYRSTREITDFSRKLLKSQIIDGCVNRRGDKPLISELTNEGAIKDKLLQDIEVYKKKGYKSIGIITRTKKEAEEVFAALKEKADVSAIMKEDDEYINGTVIIPAYLAKGLEFDVVFIYNAGKDNYSSEEERLLLYTACTRALHVLCIYYSGELTPLLKESL